VRVEEMRPDYIIQTEEEVFALARRWFGLDEEPRQSSRPESSFTHNLSGVIKANEERSA
jgi:hypothetical protein